MTKLRKKEPSKTGDHQHHHSRHHQHRKKTPRVHRENVNPDSEIITKQKNMVPSQSDDKLKRRPSKKKSSSTLKKKSSSIPADHRKIIRKQKALNKDLPPLPPQSGKNSTNIDTAKTESLLSVDCYENDMLSIVMNKEKRGVIEENFHFENYLDDEEEVQQRYQQPEGGSSTSSLSVPTNSSDFEDDEDEQNPESSSQQTPKEFDTPATSTFSSLSGSSPKLLQQQQQTNAEEQKDINKKFNIIRELVSTEKTFASDLSIIMDIYLEKLKLDKYTGYISKQDINLLALNINEIMSLSNDLYSDLVKTIPSYVFSAPLDDKDHHLINIETSIGQVILDYIPKIEQVYKYYCEKNQSQMNAFYRIKALASPVIDNWIQECWEDSKDLTTAWTLDALLIKPVQRLLKYPLLLSQLVECTHKTHVDYQSTEKASQEIKACADRIDSQEISSCSCQEKHKELLQLKDDINADAELEALLFDFMHKQKNLNQLIKSIKASSDETKNHFDINLSLGESWLDWVSSSAIDGAYDEDENNNGEGAGEKEESRPRLSLERYKQYASLSSDFSSKLLTSFTSRVDEEVLKPLDDVKSLFDSTENLINERRKCHYSYSKYLHSKFPSHHQHHQSIESASSTATSNTNLTPSTSTRHHSSNRSSNNNSNSLDFRQVKNQADLFIKYHNSMKDGLPDLFCLSNQMVDACLGKFAHIQQSWFKQSADSMAKIFDIKVNDIRDFSSTRDPIVENFQETVLSKNGPDETIKGFNIFNNNSNDKNDNNNNDSDDDSGSMDFIEEFDWFQDDFDLISEGIKLSQQKGARSSTTNSSSPNNSDKNRKHSKTASAIFSGSPKKKKEVERKSSLLSLTSNLQRSVRHKGSRISGSDL